MSHTEALSVLLASERAEDIKQCTVSLRRMFPACRVEAVYSVEDMLQCVAQHVWNVILIDEKLALEDDLETISELRSGAPHAAVIVQTESDDKTRAAQFVGGGADCCLHRNSPDFFTELPIVMREVLERCELRLQLDLARQLYDRLTERVTGLVYHLDRDGRFTHLSPAISPMLGYAAEDLIGKHYLELIHPDDRPTAKNRFNEQRSGTRATNNMSVRLLSKSGPDTQDDGLGVEFSATGVHSGRIFHGTIGVIRDDSSRVQELHDLEVRLREEFDRRQEQDSAEHRQRETELRKEIQSREDSLRRKQLSSEQQAKQLLDQSHSLQDQLQQAEQQHQARETELAEKLQTLEDQLQQEQRQHLEREKQFDQRLQCRQAELEQELNDRETQLQEEFQGRQTQLRQGLKDQESQLQEEFLRQAELFQQQQEVRLREVKDRVSAEYERQSTVREKELHLRYQQQIGQLNQKLHTLREEHAEALRRHVPQSPQSDAVRQQLRDQRELELKRRNERLGKGPRWKLPGD